MTVANCRGVASDAPTKCVNTDGIRDLDMVGIWPNVVVHASLVPARVCDAAHCRGGDVGEFAFTAGADGRVGADVCALPRGLFARGFAAHHLQRQISLPPVQTRAFGGGRARENGGHGHGQFAAAVAVAADGGLGDGAAARSKLRGD